MARLLSYSEIETALTCWARQRWDFAYGGHLAGAALKSKNLAPILSEGRAWGAGVAAWHRWAATSALAVWEAHEAIGSSLVADAKAMHDAGAPVDMNAYAEMDVKLRAMLDHYVVTASPLPNLTRLEHEIVVPIPSRSGRRSSNRYRFQCFLDGYTDDSGNQFIVEFKLRKRLQPAALVQRARQPRWYAWALAREQGFTPLGVIVDERLNEVPKDPRVLKSGKPSHAKDQLTTPEQYVEACLLGGEPPKDEVVEALRGRVWQQRIPLIFREGEIEQAGQELVSAAALVRDLDSGALTPIRNAARQRCDSCRYRDICAEPGDELYVNTLFERCPPKRHRTLEAKA